MGLHVHRVASAVLLAVLCASCSRAPSTHPGQAKVVSPQPRVGEDAEALVAFQELVRRKLGKQATVDLSDPPRSSLVFVDRTGLRFWYFRGDHLWNPDESVVECDPYQEGLEFGQLGNSHRLFVGQEGKYGNYLGLIWFEPLTKTWILGRLTVANVLVHDHTPFSYQRYELANSFTPEEVAEFEQRYSVQHPYVEVGTADLAITPPEPVASPSRSP